MSNIGISNILVYLIKTILSSFVVRTYFKTLVVALQGHVVVAECEEALGLAAVGVGVRGEEREALVVEAQGLREEGLRADGAVALRDDEVRTGLRGVELQARHHRVRCFCVLFEFKVVHALPLKAFGTFGFQLQVRFDLLERRELIRLVFLIRLGEVELALGQLGVDADAVFQAVDRFFGLVAQEQRVPLDVVALAVAWLRLHS
jgi:hypothetical protein